MKSHLSDQCWIVTNVQKKSSLNAHHRSEQHGHRLALSLEYQHQQICLCQEDELAPQAETDNISTS